MLAIPPFAGKAPPPRLSVGHRGAVYYNPNSISIQIFPCDGVKGYCPPLLPSRMLSRVFIRSYSKFSGDNFGGGVAKKIPRVWSAVHRVTPAARRWEHPASLGLARMFSDVVDPTARRGAPCDALGGRMGRRYHEENSGLNPARPLFHLFLLILFRFFLIFPLPLGRPMNL